LLALTDHIRRCIPHWKRAATLEATLKVDRGQIRLVTAALEDAVRFHSGELALKRGATATSSQNVAGIRAAHGGDNLPQSTSAKNSRDRYHKDTHGPYQKLLSIVACAIRHKRPIEC